MQEESKPNKQNIIENKIGGKKIDELRANKKMQHE